jgi:hypothetical protein
MISIRIAKHGVGDSSGATLKRLPQVICADCRKAMIPSIRKRLLFAKGLEEVTYNCVLCRATTVRSIKPDDSNEPDEKLAPFDPYRRSMAAASGAWEPHAALWNARYVRRRPHAPFSPPL